MSVSNLLDAIDAALRDEPPPPDPAESHNDLQGRGFRAATLDKVLAEVGRLKLDKATRARFDELVQKIDAARRESVQYGHFEAMCQRSGKRDHLWSK